MKTANQNFAARDLAVVWHPCTQMQDHETLPIIPVKSARGVWLEDYDGKRYVDAISSWWVNLFGHANPHINAAVKAQRFAAHPHIAEVRQTGMILALEMVKRKAPREPFPWQERRGLRVYRYPPVPI